MDDETLVYRLTLPKDKDLDKQFNDEEMNPVNEVRKTTSIYKFHFLSTRKHVKFELEPCQDL